MNLCQIYVLCIAIAQYNTRHDEIFFIYEIFNTNSDYNKKYKLAYLSREERALGKTLQSDVPVETPYKYLNR